MFREKSILDQGWINGGFFVIEPKIFKYLKNDQTVFENYPLTKLGKKKKNFMRINIKVFGIVWIQ